MSHNNDKIVTTYVRTLYDLMGIITVHTYMLSFTILTGVATLKKHYNHLWMTLPEDHMITLERLRKIYDKLADDIVSYTNSQWSNNLIFDVLISLTKNDNQLLGLSFLIERVATGGVLVSDCPNIESFRKG